MDVARDPLNELVETLRRDRHSLALEFALAAFVHAVLLVSFARWLITPTPKLRALTATEVVDVDLPKPPPPPPPEPRELPSQPETKAPTSLAPRAASPPARAAAVLVKAIDPNEPLDLTGDGFVVGTAATYAGGQTSPNGVAVRTVHVVETPLATATPPVVHATAPGPDHARPASIVDGTAWKCPFPTEADSDHIDAAISTIRVTIDTQGGVKNVDVLTDPGHGFGREARQCAMNKRWAPALSHDGQPIEGTVTIRVRFDR
jgi:periplasmic protein TonB